MNNRWRQIARVERLEKIKQAKKAYALFTLSQKEQKKFRDQLDAIRYKIINIAKTARRCNQTKWR